MNIHLEIGGRRILLTEAEGQPPYFWPAPAFEPFLAPADGPADFQFEIRARERLPDLPHGKLLYDACHGLWTLHESEGGYFVETLQPKTRRPHNRAILSPDFTRGRVFTRKIRRPRVRTPSPAVGGAHARQGSRDSRHTWSPCDVLNPLVEACLLTRLGREGGLMLHAAGVDFHGRGYVFTGPSGAGKTTLSDLFIERGARILNDERVIIREIEGTHFVYGTPWIGSNPVAHNARAPLEGFYFIRHGRGTHALRELSAGEAAALCLQQAFLPLWDVEAMEGTAAGADDLFRELGRLEYSFLKDPGAVDYLTSPRARATMRSAGALSEPKDLSTRRGFSRA